MCGLGYLCLANIIHITLEVAELQEVQCDGAVGEIVHRDPFDTCAHMLTE